MYLLYFSDLLMLGFVLRIVLTNAMLADMTEEEVLLDLSQWSLLPYTSSIITRKTCPLQLPGP